MMPVSSALKFHILLCEGPYLAAGWLGKPESPLVHERVFDIEVFRVVEDSDNLVI